MVSPGHLSTGWLTCRLRRIKCDKTRSICTRCASSSHPCLGYDVQRWPQQHCSRKPSQIESAGRCLMRAYLLSNTSASLDARGSTTAPQQNQPSPAVHNVIAMMKASSGSLSADLQAVITRRELQQKVPSMHSRSSLEPVIAGRKRFFGSFILPVRGT